MSVWHGDQHKHKATGGRKIANRKKRRFERGFFAAETALGKNKSKSMRKHGGNEKQRLLAVNEANISDASGKTEKVEIVRVIKNPANVDYDRRGVITKGTMIATSLGTARVTSRPGQDGKVNAVLVDKKED
ncbi:MAG: 30S ribosomal protein S8e [Candidatus Bathyarchaeota archaeon]|nr:30S ribosomal protein S8e [Candidatus Bathyarchaeum tardum]WGM90231.1 MAG: 30S ribosomal protein S8e [Candidatus Bathyarchaeum tardum]WNZ29684.1 MAG: 30S ribosomal protein S8e [Candidatus Bathyarchaeota archaeon]